ncbi:MAG TPA: ATP-grasp domain-containing protein [Bacteroidales bacterium]|nr:ATP-grasp domain-containing protein [Bacteroidales bacterium]
MIAAKEKLVIAVTGLNAIDSPGPGVPVIRSLRDYYSSSVRIIGLAYEALEPGIYMTDLVDKTYQLPYPSAGTGALLSRLKTIHNKEKIDVIIPNFDAEIFNFITISEELLKEGIHTFLPSRETFESRDKINLNSFGKKYDLPVPADMIIYRPSEIKAATEKFGLPIVVKGKFYEANICNTVEQAEKAFFRLQSKWGIPVIIQEFIVGIEVNIAALGDGNGNAISVVPMRKLYITDKGKAWAGVTIDDELLKSIAEKFMKGTKWKGGCELEIMIDPEGKPWIMEINPRFPAWIYLTASAGQNQPVALVKLALGESVEKYEKYDIGKVFIRYSWDKIIDISLFHKISVDGEL